MPSVTNFVDETVYVDVNATAQAVLLQMFNVYRRTIPESQALPQPCNRESLGSWLHAKTIGDIPERRECWGCPGAACHSSGIKC
jgi:hypothetical protein